MERRDAAPADPGTPVTTATRSDASPPTGDGARPRRHSPLALLAVIGGAQLMVILDTTVMIIALPSAQRALGFSNADRQWVITAYTVTFGGLLLLGGRLSDRLGAKRTLIAGVIGFALASALGGAAQSLGMLVVARGLQGAFGALLAPSVLSLLTTTFQEPGERARAFGIYATIAISGAAVGLIVGGLLTQYLDWRWCLYVNVPVSVAVAASATVLLPRQDGNPEVRIDVPGTVLGCGGLIALVYGLGDASTDGWGSPAVIASLVGSAVLLTAFVLVERQVAHPLLPLRILTDRNRAGAYLSIMLAVIANYGMFLFLTYLLQTIKGYSPVRTGFAFLPLMVVNGLTATQISSRLMARVPTRLLIVPGLLIAAVGAGVLTQLHPGSSYASSVLPAELLLGLGLGLAFVPIISTATARAEPRDAGVVSAMTNTSQQIGASVGTALLNTIAASATAAYLAGHVHAAGEVTAATVHGYAVASVYSMAVLGLAAVVSAVLIDARPLARAPDPAPAD
ncbi:MAG: MFS transporter [Acidimicrobiales bacterium]|nr:MFS transporter [Acidimicrobiales bacterium]